MAITEPSVSDFASTTVMGVVRNVVDKIVEIVPDINEADITGATMDYSGSTLTLKLTKGDGTSINATATIETGGVDVSISQSTTAISINGTNLQSATASQIGLMTSAKFNEVTTATSNIASLTALIGTDSDLITE